jgi:hypothetical protein
MLYILFHCGAGTTYTHGITRCDMCNHPFHLHLCQLQINHLLHINSACIVQAHFQPNNVVCSSWYNDQCCMISSQHLQLQTDHIEGLFTLLLQYTQPKQSTNHAANCKWSYTSQATAIGMKAAQVHAAFSTGNMVGACRMGAPQHK